LGEVGNVQADDGNEIKDKENEMETQEAVEERQEWERAISEWLMKQDREVLQNITKRLIRALIVEAKVEVKDEQRHDG